MYMCVTRMLSALQCLSSAAMGGNHAVPLMCHNRYQLTSFSDPLDEFMLISEGRQAVTEDVLIFVLIDIDPYSSFDEAGG